MPTLTPEEQKLVLADWLAVAGFILFLFAIAFEVVAIIVGSWQWAALGVLAASVSAVVLILVSRISGAKG